jgi:hypothetical protein
MAIMRTRALPTRVLAVWCPPSIGPLRTGAGHQATESLKASDHSGDAFLNRFIVEKLVLNVFKIESKICTWFCSLNQAASGFKQTTRIEFKQTTRIEFTQSTRNEFVLFASNLNLLIPLSLTNQTRVSSTARSASTTAFEALPHSRHRRLRTAAIKKLRRLYPPMPVPRSRQN